MPNEHETLTSLFGDIANAIRAKTGESGTIVADNFPTAIENIPSGGSDPVIQALSVTENGTYTAPSGVDGYSPVTVNVSGGGGGSLPSVISKIDGGSFTVDTDTTVRNYKIYHNLGVVPKGFLISAYNVQSGDKPGSSNNTKIISLGCFVGDFYSGSSFTTEKKGSIVGRCISTNGSLNFSYTDLTSSNIDSNLTSEYISPQVINTEYFNKYTYHWLAWA